MMNLLPIFINLHCKKGKAVIAGKTKREATLLDSTSPSGQAVDKPGQVLDRSWMSWTGLGQVWDSWTAMDRSGRDQIGTIR